MLPKRNYPTNKEKSDAFKEWISACDFARESGAEHLIERHMYKSRRGDQVNKIRTAALNLRMAVNLHIARKSTEATT
jgi:hypothetical protein